jgi:hypothetical protein
MQQEFNYGMQSMGAQFEYQDKFANNQFDRDLGTLAATGDQTRANIGAQGAQDRLTTVTGGEQQRETMKEENRLQAKTRADQSSYSNKGARSF